MGINYYEPGSIKPDIPFKRKSLGKQDRWIVINRDNFQCYECEATLIVNMKRFPQISVINGVFHHVLQQVFGGKNDHTNTCILCVGCHKITHGGNEVKEKYLAMLERFERGKKLNGLRQD
jgi:5-methylcytosine-specific restriction endonuclease McrA